MLALFRFFLAFFLGVDPELAERLTDPPAWRNPIAQVQALVDGGTKCGCYMDRKENNNAKAQRRKEVREG